MINGQKEGEATIYIYGIRETLEEGGWHGRCKTSEALPKYKTVVFSS